LAQVAALGATVALLAGHTPQGAGASWYALAFTAAGAAVLASLRDRPALARAAIPAEAVIGIVYAVAAALTVLTLERVPLGGEQVKALLVGSLLGVTRDDVFHLAALYAGLGIVAWLARRPLAALSFGGPLRHARLWDFGFYLVFGLVVTSSVRVAGALAGAALAVVPQADHVWLDALEATVPAAQDIFLSPHERAVADEARRAIARGTRDVGALRARQADIAWGARVADAEERERLRQF